MDQSSALQSSRKAVVAMFILSIALFHQGCLAAAWVVAVTADSMRAGDVQFQPFEKSWVSTENVRAIVDRSSLSSLAFMPVDGDELMGARLTKILKEKTALRVVTPARPRAPLTVAKRDQDHVVLARELSREFAVDAILYGHVVGSASHSSEWGVKAEEPRRLFLYMIDRDGHLLWRDELPFLIVTGTKPALEESVQLSLTRHFMDHVHELGLDDAGYFPSKSS
ncbi:MAG TPA: hypothetical protein VJL88_01320 [Nitrospira sp.]|nr:hypothetical protein [Nitrospira sp.]